MSDNIDIFISLLFWVKLAIMNIIDKQIQAKSKNSINEKNYYNWNSLYSCFRLELLWKRNLFQRSLLGLESYHSMKKNYNFLSWLILKITEKHVSSQHFFAYLWLLRCWIIHILTIMKYLTVIFSKRAFDS